MKSLNQNNLRFRQWWDLSRSHPTSFFLHYYIILFFNLFNFIFMKQLTFGTYAVLMLIFMPFFQLSATNLSVVSPENCMACTTPTGLGVMNQTGTSATIKWSPVSGATSYLIEVENGTGNVAPFFFTQTITATAKVVTGLTANKNYKFKVRTNCGSKHSNWSAVFAFGSSAGTTGSCGIPSGLVANNITATSATLAWTPIAGASSYTIQLENGTGNPTVLNVTYTSTTNSKLVTGLLAGKAYKFKVRTVCAGVTGTWSANVTFVTKNTVARFSTEDAILPTLNLFPNPSTDGIFHLQNSEQTTLSVQVFSLSGQLILQKQVNETDTEIDLSQFSSGMYFMYWKSDLASGTMRMVRE